MGSWKSDFFKCRGLTCVLTAFCPCVSSFMIGQKMKLMILAIASVILWLGVLAFNSSGAGYRASYRQKTSGGSTVYVNAGWSVGSIFFLGFVIVVFIMRNKLRKEDGIEGNFLTDGALSCCCTSCTLCQMYDHMELDVENDCINRSG